MKTMKEIIQHFRVFSIFLITFLFSFPLFAEPSFHQKIEDVDIYVLSLGNFNPPTAQLIPNNSNDADFIKIKTKTAPQNKQNILLLKHEKFIALVDTGYSKTFSILQQELKHLNLSPKDITHILLTHAHPDHIGGMIFEGTKTFPNAKFYLDKKEYDYWKEKKTANQIFDLYKEQISFFPENQNLLPSYLTIQNIPAYGHTPGHNLIEFKGEKRHLIFWADLMHFYAAQIERPEIGIAFDENKEKAIQTRLQFLEEFKNKNIGILGAHLPFGKPIFLK